MKMKKNFPAKTIALLAELTRANDHTEARRVIALSIGSADLESKFRLIQRVTKRFGYLTHTCTLKRDEFSAQLMTELKAKYINWNEVSNSL